MKLKKNQVWVWEKDGVLLAIFIIKSITKKLGRTAATFYGPLEEGSYYTVSFFDDMELIEDINAPDLLTDEEKEMIIKDCKTYGVPIPGM